MKSWQDAGDSEPIILGGNPNQAKAPEHSGTNRSMGSQIKNELDQLGVKPNQDAPFFDRYDQTGKLIKQGGT